MNEMSIGKRIQTLRKQKSLTQEQLAERVGVSPQAVSKWENDNSCPDISILPALAKELGVSIDTLLGYDAPEVKQGEVVEDLPKSGFRFTADDREDADTNFWIDLTYGGKLRKIWGGLFVLLAGVLLVVDKALPDTFPCSYWSLIWPTALLFLVGLPGTVTRKPSWFCVGVTVLSAYALLSNLNIAPLPLSWWMVLAAFLILCGIFMLVQLFTKDGKGVHFKPIKSGSHGKMSTTFEQNNGQIVFHVSFGDLRQRVDPQEFVSGDVDVNFGDGVLDLTAITSFAPQAELKCNVSFGDLTVYLPQSVRIIKHSSSAFGDASITGQPASNAPYTLKVNASVSFGDLNFQYK